MKPSHDQTPQLSVVLPTYNRAGYLAVCMPTILNQTFRNFELIIINDGSTDNTAEVIAGFQDKRIVYIEQENRGEYTATNIGLKAAKAEYITWVHSDDMLPLDSFKRRVLTLSSTPTTDFVHGDICKIDKNGNDIGIIKATSLPARGAFNDYLQHYVQKEKLEDDSRFLVHHLTIMFRKQFLQKVGYFDESLPYAGDFDWMLRALKIGSMTKIPKVLYNYRFHSESRRETDPSGVKSTAVQIIEEIINRYRD